MGRKASLDHYMTDEYCRAVLGKPAEELHQHEAAQALQRLLMSQNVTTEWHPWTKRWYGKVKGDS